MAPRSRTLRARSKSRFRCRSSRSSCRPKVATHTGCTGSAQILRQAKGVAWDLALAGFAADLQHEVADLRDTGGAYRMSFRLQASGGVDRPLALQRCVSGEGVRSATTLLYEPKVLASDDFRDREAIVEFGKLDILRRDARHLVCLFGGPPDGGERGDVVLLVQGDIVGRLRDSQNPHRLAGELGGPLQGRQDHGRGAIGNQ